MFQTEVEFLGRKVNKTGMAIGDEYVEVVKKWQIPKTTNLIIKSCNQLCISHRWKFPLQTLIYLS